MNDRNKVFLDSNVVIYAYHNEEKDKQTIAKLLINNNNSVISTQVLQEISNTLSRKFKAKYDVIQALLVECIQNCGEVYINTQQTVFKACSIADRYQFSFYDSLIVAAAIESGCNTIYSEDLQHNQITENTLVIINPFCIHKQ
ncbi:PIN domain-containing protein [Candidatus Symbiothrix dinenymphae]|uniref:PIN domain-containing protein n=1 Tax=Candidatus Symbiothrix dinenymphae TaxID=467085 RepID=UPI0006E17A66|nr:PIN domain-containing protein [Candidatus Symbiothrix dinenymphae]